MIGPSLEILLVEREVAIATAVAATLRRRGHRVTTLHRAEDVLLESSASGRALPDVLICSIELDGMDGLELLEGLRRRGQTVRAVLTSALPNLDDCRHALRLGAAELLAKPIDADELIEAVEAQNPLAPLPASPDPLRFQCTFGAIVEDAEMAVRDLTAQLMRWGLGPTARARVATAVIEALDNTVRHAYPLEPGQVELEARCDGREVIVFVRDQGVGFDASALGAGVLADPLQSGLSRAAALSEKLRVDSEGGTRVELHFAAYRTSFDERGAIDLSEQDWLTPGMSRRVLEILRDEGNNDVFHLSPAMAVTVGRLLNGPTTAPSNQEVLRS